MTLEQKLLLLRRTGILTFYTEQELDQPISELARRVDEIMDEEILKMLAALPPPKSPATETT